MARHRAIGALTPGIAHQPPLGLAECLWGVHIEPGSSGHVDGPCPPVRCELAKTIGETVPALLCRPLEPIEQIRGAEHHPGITRIPRLELLRDGYDPAVMAAHARDVVQLEDASLVTVRGEAHLARRRGAVKQGLRDRRIEEVVAHDQEERRIARAGPSGESAGTVAQRQSCASANSTTQPRRRAMSVKCPRTVSASKPTVTMKRRMSAASFKVHMTRSASVKPSTRVKGFGWPVRG